VTAAPVAGPEPGRPATEADPPLAAYPGTPDGFQRLWTPHRQVYIARQAGRPADDCVFCLAPKVSADDNLVVHLGELAYVVLNLYPYNSGHLLVCPYRHLAAYTDLTDLETVELARLTQQAMRTLTAYCHPQGFNLGLNQGSIAGAGIAGHLHQHIVPRWGGDANFFPIVAQTRALPQLLGQTRDGLRTLWPNAKSAL
jgi:ATP adenylyltransferase